MTMEDNQIKPSAKKQNISDAVKMFYLAKADQDIDLMCSAIDTLYIILSNDLKKNDKKQLMLKMKRRIEWVKKRFINEINYMPTPEGKVYNEQNDHKAMDYLSSCMIHFVRIIDDLGYN